MPEYEWEPRRTPRPTRPEFLANYHRHVRAVAEFAVLEHPRESVGWILKQHSLSKARLPSFWQRRKAAAGSRTKTRRSRARE